MTKNRKIPWNVMAQEERGETSTISHDQIGENPFAAVGQQKNNEIEDNNRDRNRDYDRRDIPRVAVENRERLLYLDRSSVEDALFLHPNDHAGVQLVGVQLSGKNFYTWSRAMRRALGARNKLDFINGNFSEPLPESPYYKAWLKVDYMVTTWIINSMTKELANAFQYIDDSHRLWDEIQQRFDRSNGPKIYRIRRELSGYLQGNQSVMMYFNNLNAMWDELNLLTPNRSCDCGDGEKLMQFLLGLNDCYETVRSQILLLQPLPTVSRAYSMVLQDEDQRQVTTQTHGVVDSALYVDNRGHQSLGEGSGFGYYKPRLSREEKKKLRCIHCNKSGHEIQNCFELNGYPDWFKRLKDSRGKEDLYYDTQSGEDINLKGNVSKLIQEEVAKCFAQYQPKKRLTGEDDNVNLVQASDNSSCRVVEHHAFSIIDKMSTDDLIMDSGASHVHINDLTQPKNLAAEDWHRLLGHVSINTMKHIPGVKDLCNEEVCHHLVNCEICHKSEQCRNPFPILQKRADRLFGLVHGDVWGPYKAENISNTHYVLTLVEDHSRLVWTYLLSSKTQLVGILKSYIGMVKTQFGANILNFKSDSGSVFDNASVKQLFEEAGIIHKRICAYASQNIGIVERKHCNLIQIARALMLQSKLPDQFWPYSILSATWILNRLPHSLLGWKSPYSVLFAKSASLDQFKHFGSLAYTGNLSPKSKKSDDCSISCVMLGISGNQKGYLLYDLKDQKVITSRYVHCLEHVYPLDKSLMNFSLPTNVVQNVPQVLLNVPSPTDMLLDISHTREKFLDTPISDVFFIPDASECLSSTPILASSSKNEILLPITDIHPKPSSCIVLDRDNRTVISSDSLDVVAALCSESCLTSDLDNEEIIFPTDMCKSIDWPEVMFKELEVLVKPLADLFTKGQYGSSFQFLLGKMGLMGFLPAPS